ncbi:MAG: cryptochrome/photolyase family protein [Candidatus Thermoplasmatota archaeon]|nr:cryptochrome/photolyase family protein [Candidatus Thermoplasmatota archaeon]
MDKSDLTWYFVPYDQLNHEIFPWSQGNRENNGLILIESKQKGTSLNYHKQKLALLLSNMRHFAAEAKALGHPVNYQFTDGSYYDLLSEICHQTGPVKLVNPAERSLRTELNSLIESGVIELLPHEGWLTKREWFTETVGTEPPFRMDKFYQRVRKETGVLMQDGKPMGGKYSFDAENRLPWSGDPVTQEEITFPVDDIDKAVMNLVNQRFESHPGVCDLSKVPTTIEQHNQALNWGMANMEFFGPYEDAMSSKSRYLFHSKLAISVNLHRLSPEKIVNSALETNAPINSIEGFFRQMIWREYVKHVHDVTDGFRALEVYDQMRDEPNFLNQNNPLPAAYWGEKTGLNCLDEVVSSVMEEGWTHHIPRLMILSNFASLLDINPRELTTWFHEAFIDAYDWVVEPNVLGMGTYSLGSAMMTKPYVSGTPYINKMSDYCKNCKFNPKKDCKVSNLYWAFLERHKDSFNGNIRMAMPLRSLAKRSDEKKAEDVLAYQDILAALSDGREYLGNQLRLTH